MVHDLQDQIGRGAFDPQTVRVWHLKNNPAARALELRATQAATPDTQTHDTSSAQMDAIQSEKGSIAPDYEKLAQRTREAARAKISEVVESIYYLFGWRLRIMGAVYTMESMYAERAQDCIKFTRNARGGFDLVATEYVERALRGEVDILLRRMDSIPAFLAHVQMSLFEQSTAFAMPSDAPNAC